MIEMTPIKSGQIESVGYDPINATLAVKFRTGGLYHYHGVGPDAFDDLLKAESIGMHHAKHIRGSYPFTKQEPKPD